MGYRPRYSERRGTTRGGNTLFFFLGMCVVAAFCGVVYYAYTGQDSDPPPAARKNPGRRLPAQRSRPTATTPLKVPGKPSTWPTAGEPWQLPKKEPRIRPANNAQSPREPASNEDTVETPKADDVDTVETPKVDHVVSATKHERLRLKMGLGFADRPEAYYLRVVLKSYRNDRWSLGRREWMALADRSKAVSTRGNRYRCSQMWPVLWPDEKCTLVNMIFVVSNGAKIRKIVIDGKRWKVGKVVDSGE